MDPPTKDESFQRLIRALAESEDVQPCDLPPLADAIDTDALLTFLESSGGSAKAEFQYYGRRIRLTADGSVTVSKPVNDQNRYVARCTTCDEEKQDVLLETAQDFFAIHADQKHEVEIFRSGEAEPGPSEDDSTTGSGRSEGTDPSE